jgi:hypothetical protein
VLISAGRRRRRSFSKNRVVIGLIKRESKRGFLFEKMRILFHFFTFGGTARPSHKDIKKLFSWES